MLQTEIKNDMIKAWKARDMLTKNVLNLLLGKIKNKAIDLKVDELPDSEILVIVQKFIKELEDERESFRKANRNENVVNLTFQLSAIQNYLPKQLSEDEIRAEINKLEDKSMKSIMSYFKTNFAGKVDMSLVSRIARS